MSEIYSGTGTDRRRIRGTIGKPSKDPAVGPIEEEGTGIGVIDDTSFVAFICYRRVMMAVATSDEPIQCTVISDESI